MSEPMTQTPMTSRQAQPLSGTITIPGDKSISHRAIMLGSMAIGRTTVSGLLEGEDVLCTIKAMQAMGATITKQNDSTYHIQGVGIGGLHEPNQHLDMGNSGTSTRLLMGLIGSHPITVTLTGDQSLSKRPMGRVIKPLEMMGTHINAREGGRLPLTITGKENTLSIDYELPVASAQVKSCILLAGLNAYGRTSVTEQTLTRDHTENMLKAFGVKIDIENLPGGGQKIMLEGHQSLTPCDIHVPADPSSAAFPVVAALINEGSEITLPNIGMNDRRDGLYISLQEMGADITITNERLQSGERVVNLTVKGTRALKGTNIPASRVSSMIDEFPILAVAAACAEGTTTMTGLAELRVKESDRLQVMAEGLSACGVKLEMGEDSLTIHGTGKPPTGHATIKTHHDHRIAMSFLILGTITDQSVSIDDATPILTSFPNFVTLMNDLGTRLEEKRTNY